VSKSTVSLVLNGSPLIPGETSERVREAAARLGYVYNRRAGQLRGGSSNTIAVVINDLMNPFFAEILVGIERKLVDAGYVVLMAHTSEDVARQDQVLHTMREQGTAGLILCPAYGTPRTLRVPSSRGASRSWSWCARWAAAATTSRVPTTNAACSTRPAPARCRAQAHRIPGRTHRHRARAAPEGLQGRAGRAQDQARPRTAAGQRPDPRRRYQTMQQLLDTQPDATAAICYNDVVAFGAMAALGERGLRAGVDFALMGFDNVADAAHSNPPLSTVDIRAGELGEHAASLLLARIADPERGRQSYVAEPKVLIRQSG
jgi:LacI family transcriptional regulator